MSYMEAEDADIDEKVFNLDGIWHIVGNEGCCWGACGGLKTCKCGGLIHRQPVYGGIMDVCDICEVDNFCKQTPYPSQGKDIK